MNDTHWTRLGLIGDWIPASLLTAQTNYFGNRTGIRADALGNFRTKAPSLACSKD